jgi:hypothetical protein
MRSLVRILAVVSTAIVAACSNESGPSRLVTRIVSGNNQIVPPGWHVSHPRQLPLPVVAQVVRTKSGAYAVRRLDPQRALDLLVPRAYAQTDPLVGDTPVPGAEVCTRTEPGEQSIVPDLPGGGTCVIADAEGKATFPFVYPEVVGEYWCVIEGTVAGEKTTFDTLKAVVERGTLDSTFRYPEAGVWRSASPAIVYAYPVKDVFGAYIRYRIVGDDRVQVQSDSVGKRSARTLTFTAEKIDPATHYTLELRDSDDKPVGRLRYRIVDDAGVPTIEWVAHGLNLTP